MKISIEKSAFNNTKYAQKDDMAKHAQKHSSSAKAPNKDEFTHDLAELDNELNIYKRYKNNLTNMPNEYKNKLKELLNMLKKSKEQNINLSNDASMLRDIFIDKIENIFKEEIMQGQMRVNNMLLESARQTAEQNKSSMEFLARQMEILKSCLEISAKIVKGTASEAEKRFLMKTDPQMYSMAIAGAKIDRDNNENSTTVKIDFEDETADDQNANHSKAIGTNNSNADIIKNIIKFN